MLILIDGAEKRICLKAKPDGTYQRIEPPRVLAVTHGPRPTAAEMTALLRGIVGSG